MTTAVSPLLHQRTEIVFIESNVADYATLIAGFDPALEVHVLDASSDGLAQMAAILAGRSGIDAIHLISHGAAGTVQLGTVTLDEATLLSRQTELATIGQSLSSDGDLLLYGCNVAEGQTGIEFIGTLAQTTGADVAASDDLTGNAALGGDWVLESATGTIGCMPLQPAAFQGVLAAPADENYNDNTSANFFSNTFVLDGIKYTVTGTNGPYTTITSNDGTSPLSNNAADYYLLFDQAGLSGVSSIKIEANSGSAFTLAGLSIDALADGFITLTPDANAAEAKSYGTSSGGTWVTQQNIDLSADGAFQNITSFTIAGDNLELNLDDLNFETANAAPAFSNLNGDSAYTENGSAVVVDSNVTVADTELDALNVGNGDYAGASLTIARNGGANAQDSFGFNTAGAAFTVSGANLQSGGQTFATFTNSGGSLGISFTSSGTTATSVLVDDVLQHIAYSNTSDAPPASVTLDWSFNDGSTAGTGQSAVLITAVNDAPILAGAGSTTSYPENAAATAIAAGLTVSDIDSTTLASAKVSISGGFQSSEDLLAFTNAVGMGNITGSYNSGTGVLTLNSTGATATLAQWQTALRAVTYANGSDAPDTTSRAISFSVNDGSADSAAVTQMLTVSAVNDAPTLTTTNPALTGTNEDTVSSATPVSTLLTDTGYADDGALSGIAITATTGNGIWQYSTDGTTWQGVGTVSANAALLLDSSTQVRYLPDGDNGETPTLTFRGWDQTVGSASTNLTRNTADTTTNGGISAFSTGTAQASMTVTAENDAPTDIALGNATASRYDSANVIVGTLSSTDVDSGDTPVYSLAAGSGDTDNALFTISGGQLRLTDPSSATAGTYSVRIRTTDQANEYFEKAFTITVTDALTVTTNIDEAGGGTYATELADGAGLSLREAVGLANAAGGGTMDVAVGVGSIILGSALTVDDNITLDADAYGTNTISGSSVALSGSLTLNNGSGDTLSLGNVISGTGSLVKTGEGVLRLAAVNSYTGGTTVSAGTLEVGNSLSLGSGTLTLAAGSVLTNAIGVMSLGNMIQLDGTASIDIGLQSLSLSNNISGAGGLTKTGTGWLALEGTNTYTGATTVYAGTLALHNGNALSDSSAVNVESGAELIVFSSETVGSLAGAGTVRIASATLTVGSDNTTTTCSGQVTNTMGTGNLTKTGTGTFTLSGNSIYTGVTNVEGGTLVLTGSLASAVNVGTSATFDGRGGNSQAVAVQAGGLLTINGNNAEDFTTGGLTLASGATFHADIGGTTAGSGYDQLLVNGGVALGNANLDLALIGGFTPTAGNTFTLISNDGVDPVTGTFAGLAEGATLAVAGKAFTISYQGGDGNDVVLTASSLPPSIATNAALTLSEGGSATLTNTQLAISDPDSTAGDLTLTLASIPAHGVLYKDGYALKGGDTFTQADIDAGHITYRHGGSDAASDGFTFTVSDGAGAGAGAGGTISSAFGITVNAVNDAPTFAAGDGKVTTDVSGSYDYGFSVTVQADGKILVAGSSHNGGNEDVALVRHNRDGSLDTSFNGTGKVTTAIGSGYDEGQSVTVQADGKILVAGFSDNGSNCDFALVRYNADGSLDGDFGATGKVTTAIGTNDEYGFSVAVQANGQILVAGESNGDFALVRYNVDGTLDTTFNGGVVTTNFGMSYERSYSVTVQDNGKILIAGYSGNVYYDFAVVRYNADGTLDTTFNGTGKVTTEVGTNNDFGNSVTVQADGKILVAGGSHNGDNVDFALVRYNTDGSLDPAFGSGGKVTTAIGAGNDAPCSVTVQADGKILVAGYSRNGTYNDFALVRYKADGSLDDTFNGTGKVTTAIGTGNDAGYSITLQADGKILVAGVSDNGSDTDFALVRYNPDGSLDTTFDAVNTLDGAPTFTENGSPVVLDSTVRIYDAELAALNGGAGNYAGATLTLARDGGANPQDLFDLDTTGASFTLVGGTLQSSGQTFATLNTTGGTLTLSFTDSGTAPTQALVNEVLSRITYANSSSTPPASVQIDWTFNDGNTATQGAGGAQTAIGYTTVSITAVNDAPVITSTATVSVPENGTAVTTVTASDADGDALTYSLAGGADAAHFTINASTGVLTFVTAPNYEAPTDADANNTYALIVQASDGSATDQQALTVTVTDVNETVTPPPTPSAPLIDGVSVQATQQTNTSGLTTTTVSVAPVSASRVEDPSTPHKLLADIPLVSGSTGETLLNVGLPTGIGMQSIALSGNDLTLHQQLINASEPRITDDAAWQQILSDGIDAYTAGVTDPGHVTVRTLVLSAAGGSSAPGQPIVITGASGTGENDSAHPLRQEALVIDARNLPAGSVLSLDQVEFAIVIGPVTVTGGAGRNLVFGDGSAQTIILGVEDDILHGGAGDDTVGSHGGNDLLYGDAGHDTVVGGEGNDTLDGGTGDDLLQGGSSDAGTWSFTLNAQNQLVTTFTAATPTLAQHASEALTCAWSQGASALTGYGGITFADQPVDTLETIALLFQALGQRLPDVAEMNDWANQGLTPQQLAQLAYDAHLGGQAIALSLTAQSADLIGWLWGSDAATPELTQAVADHIEQGGSWADVVLAGIRHDTFRGPLEGTDGTLTLTQSHHSSETGWSADTGNDTLNGGTGNDTLVGGRGSDILDGGDGLDTAVFSGSRSASQFRWTGDTLRIATGDDTDQLNGIERLQFADQKLALDLDGNAGLTMAFIATVAPQLLDDLSARGLILGLLDGGETLLGLSQKALDLHLIPDDNAGLATTLYQHALNGQPTEAQTQALTDYIDAYGQAGFVAAVAGLHLNIDLVGLQQAGVEYA